MTTAAPTMTDKLAAIEAAQTPAPRSVRSREFACEIAASFRRQLARKGSLSAKQVALLDRLYSEATTPPAPAPAAANLNSAGLDGVRALFAKAVKNGAKRPGIRVNCEGVELHITRATDDSSNPGFIYVKADGRYVGKIAPNGRFTEGRDFTPDAMFALEAFGGDPVAHAVAHGKDTGACCFCSITLDDPVSKQVGYGPQCAKKYELAYPARSRKALAAAQAADVAQTVRQAIAA